MEYLLVPLLFVLHYALFKYFISRSNPAAEVFKPLLISYIGAIGIAFIVFLVSMPFFLNRWSGNEVLALVIWYSGFFIPLVILVYRKLKTPIVQTILMIIIPGAVLLTPFFLA